VGTCRFCGRGVCENHAKSEPYILNVYGGADGPKALVVEDALHCGTCSPRPDPVNLPELDGGRKSTRGTRRKTRSEPA
jgi:hypothetical protein